MEKLQQYHSFLGEGQQFLDNHNQLLESLIISKQNANNSTPNQESEGVGNESV